jgi:hypothetical protein
MVGVITNSVPMAIFGPGSLYVTRNDVAAQTPINIGYAQEFSYDESAESKELYGQNQYPLVIARGTIKASGKVKAATVSGIALNAVFNGASFASGQLQMVQGEAVSIPATPGPYTVTVAGSATFNQDLGVRFALSGLPLAKVAAGPTTGQYSVNETTGVYTFAAADQALGVLITYAKTATGGQLLTVTNTPIGQTPTFQIDYATSLYNKPYYARFFACVSTKLTRAHKLVDFMMPEIDFGFFATAAGNVYSVSYPELS